MNLVQEIARMECLVIPVLPRMQAYAYVLKDGARCALIDACDDPALFDTLLDEGLRPETVLVTHRDWDHVDGLPRVVADYAPHITGPALEPDIPHIDRRVAGGETLEVLGRPVEVIFSPGHTPGHVAYHFRQDGVVFVGDAIFSLGCGRMRGPRAVEMWEGLARLRALPGETRLYGGHEYTLDNARFALTIEPENDALHALIAKAEARRERGEPTYPTTIAEERAANPFLRCDEASVARAVGLEGAAPEAVFAALRNAKDGFNA